MNYVCDYGCGKEAKFQFKNGRWCCEDHYTKCIAQRKGRFPKLKYVKNSNHICKWCGKEAHWQFKNGSWCCEKYSNSCPIIIEKNRKGHIEVINSIPKYFKETNHVCEYCGNKAYWKFKNGNWCCSSHVNKCPSKKINLSESHKYYLKDYQEKFPIFYKVEKLREDPETGEIQVHCKNHNCLNSKEMSGWFTPSKSQIGERIRSIKSGIGNNHFYCSNHCKLTCDLYHKSVDQIMSQDRINTGRIEEDEKNIPGYDIFRQEVFRRNIEEYEKITCEFCGNTNKDEMSVHHENPHKTHPEQSLDPINGWVLCGFGKGNNCHYLIGHKLGTKCSTSYLRKLICKRKYKNDNTRLHI